MTILDLLMPLLTFYGLVIGVFVGAKAGGFKGAFVGGVIGLVVGWASGTVIVIGHTIADGLSMWLDHTKKKRAKTQPIARSAAATPDLPASEPEFKRNQTW